MSRRYGTSVRALLVFVDAVTAGFVGVLVYQAAAHPGTSLGGFLDVFWVRAILYAGVWVSLLYVNGAYRLRAYWSIGGEARSVVTATFWLAVLGLGALVVFGATETDRGYVLLLFPIQGIVTIATRTGLRITLNAFRRRGFDTRALLIMGTGEPASAFAERVHANPSWASASSGSSVTAPRRASRATCTWAPSTIFLGSSRNASPTRSPSVCHPRNGAWPRHTRGSPTRRASWSGYR